MIFRLEMVGRCITGLFLLTALSLGALPAHAKTVSPPPTQMIVTLPALQDGSIYFVSRPGTLYAFDERKNELKWRAVLEPVAVEVNEQFLPAPAPMSVETYVLVHIGRCLWAVSKVDGHTVWSVEELPEASRENLRRSSNPLPGYGAIGEGTNAAVVTLEEEPDGWRCRRRRLGDGSLEWEFALDGVPTGWWVHWNELWVVCRRSNQADREGPGTLTKLDAGSGEALWRAPIKEGTQLRATLRATNRILLLEEQDEGQYEVRAFSEDSGDLYRSISYSAGAFVDAFQSEDKLLLLHGQESSSRKAVSLRLYFSSLNPILAKPAVLYPHTEKFFPGPVVDRTLLLYGGTAYSIYTGRPVWQEDIQGTLVDWASDEDQIYIWDSAGEVRCLDRVAGQDTWRSAIPPFPEGEYLGPNHGSAGLVLNGGWLMATTPFGELYRIDAATGDLHPGLLRLRPEGESGQRGTEEGARRVGGLWLWIALVVICVAVVSWVWITSRRQLAPQASDENDWQ